ncbi:one cut domain family member 3 [Urocitellus parryii]
MLPCRPPLPALHPLHLSWVPFLPALSSHPISLPGPDPPGSALRPAPAAAARWRCPRPCSPAACKRKEQEQQKERALQPKKQRLVFTDLQRRTLIAIFKENKRPSKEMQVTISQQLGLELNTVSNFFMNARRRCMNRWAEEPGAAPGGPAGAAATFSKA